ncbi:MAG: hypothetical protein KDB46_08420 [Solirubrobacterales bacterium]|nr:hypothetical protein [Solirubrobacterales bacterium]
MGIDSFRVRAASVAAASVAVAATLFAAAPAESVAKPKAPKGFFGVHVRGLDGGNFTRMRKANAGIVRTGFNLSTLRSSPYGPDNWSIFDNYVAGTANNRMDLMPVVYGIPAWLPGEIMDPVVQAAWQQYLTDLVERYGPGGDFWKLHPRVRHRPVRYWQLWNEPNSFVNWEDPDGREFGRFLTRSADVIHGLDPGASVVSGGVVSEPLNPDVERGNSFLRDMLAKRRTRRAVDVVAVHPYAKNASAAKRAMKDARRVLDHRGMKRTPIWISEIGWGSTTPGSSGRARRRAGPGHRWAMTPSRQRHHLRRTFKIALRQRLRLGVGRVIWYQWKSGPDSDCRWCETAGLLDGDGDAKRLLGDFRKLARR